MISKLENNDYEKGGTTASLSNCFRLKQHIYQGNQKLEVSPLAKRKKNPKNWSHVFIANGMIEITQEEFYGIIDNTCCDLINSSVSDDAKMAYDEIKNIIEIYKEGQITKSITIPYRGRSRELKYAYHEEYGYKCQLCDKLFLKANGKGYIIDIHHLFPIAKGKRISNLKDVKGLCPNCHRFVHSIKDFENKSWDEIVDEYQNNLKKVKQVTIKVMYL